MSRSASLDPGSERVCVKDCEVRAWGDVLCQTLLYTGVRCRTAHIRRQATAVSQRTRTTQRKHLDFTGCSLWGVRHTRHARGRSARRPPPSLAADHAAALWQLWCRVGRTTTITCQVVESHALYHRLQRATGAERGENVGTAQRAGDGGRTYPANQHRVCIHTLSCVRRLTMLVPIGTAFGYGTRTHTLSRSLAGREASKCAVRPQSAARADHLRQITWRSYHHVGITTAVPILKLAPRTVHVHGVICVGRCRPLELPSPAWKITASYYP